jgi:hypothetical protein
VLENSKCIDKAERQNIIFKMSISCPKYGLLFITSFNLD